MEVSVSLIVAVEEAEEQRDESGSRQQAVETVVGDSGSRLAGSSPSRATFRNKS